MAANNLKKNSQFVRAKLVLGEFWWSVKSFRAYDSLSSTKFRQSASRDHGVEMLLLLHSVVWIIQMTSRNDVQQFSANPAVAVTCLLRHPVNLLQRCDLW